MKIVVTGGAGFIGHHLIKSLIAAGHECVAIDNERSGNWNQVSQEAKHINQDLTTIPEEKLSEILEGTDILYHLAAEKYNSSNMTPERVINANIVATNRLFSSAVSARVRRIVFTSSLYGYGSLGPEKMNETDLPSPTTHYGLSKVCGEQLLATNCRDTSSTWNVARLFFIYGPEQYSDGGYKSVIVKNLENLGSGSRVVICGDGHQSLDYVYVDDCVDALIKLGTSEVHGKVVNVASGKGVEVSDVLQTLCKVAKKDFDPVFIEKDWTHGSRRVGDNQLIQKEFGWIPSTSLEEGLRRILEEKDQVRA